MTAPKMNVYVRIMRAASRGEGLRLTAEEAITLSMDTAIETVATNQLTDEELLTIQSSTGDEGWSKVRGAATPERTTP